MRDANERFFAVRLLIDGLEVVESHVIDKQGCEDASHERSRLWHESKVILRIRERLDIRVNLKQMLMRQGLVGSEIYRPFGVMRGHRWYVP